ncbi:MAG: molybdopterin oxidoreductase [Desulfobulbaceae bacterium A2]|nr:MAG: molybdopterin oxidoreductase [Desulfobulbaceae bacterium A2]
MQPDQNDYTLRSVCRICHGGCGALLTVRDGKLIRVSGDPESPMSKGWMCVKGMHSVHIANNPQRLTHPLRRNKKTGMWDVIAWETALDEISQRLAAFRQESGPESLAIGQGTGRHHYMHVVRFANAYGTPNWFEPGLAQCFIPRISVSNITYGKFLTCDYYGKTPPQCILFWGHNPLVSSPDGELGIAAKRALQAGAQGIAVDPRRSETARRCKLWLPIRPGTDAALALAMMHVIIGEQLYDSEYIKQYTFGFDALRTHVADCTPGWAEAITGVEHGLIVAASRLFATCKPAMLDWGLGIEQNTNCLQTVRAIACLRALAGNIDVPGGDVFGMNILKAYPTLSHKLPPGSTEKRLGAKQFKLLGGWRAFMPSAHIPTLIQAMTMGEPYRVRGLLVFGSNPLTTLAESKKVHAALQQLELLVVTDLFMTPTAELADYVLPAAFWTEVDQVIAYPLVAENIVFAQQKATQTGECRQDEWILNELAKRLRLPHCEEDLTSTMRHQLAPSGISLEALRRQGSFTKPMKYFKFKQDGFRTPSKKIEFYSQSLKRLGYDPLPTYAEPGESPVSRPDLHRSFPYVLITGSRQKPFFHSEHRQIEQLRARQPDPLAAIHPALAQAQAIAEGDWIVIETQRGAIRMRARITPDQREDTVSIDHGWWFPEDPGADHGVWRSNANVLTSLAGPYDPGFGTYALRGLLCSVRREEPAATRAAMDEAPHREDG